MNAISAEAVAGCIAMGAGSYLASEAEEAFYRAEIGDERRELEEYPERERVGRQRQGFAGLQVLLIGGLSAAVGFAIGHFMAQLV